MTHRPQSLSSAQAAKTVRESFPPEPLPLPALIYQTVKQMDDYQAKDMHYGYPDILTLRNPLRIDVILSPQRCTPPNALITTALCR